MLLLLLQAEEPLFLIREKALRLLGLAQFLQNPVLSPLPNFFLPSLHFQKPLLLHFPVNLLDSVPVCLFAFGISHGRKRCLTQTLFLLPDLIFHSFLHHYIS